MAPSWRGIDCVDEGTLKERMEDVDDGYRDHPIVQEILSFIREGGKRSLCTPRDGHDT